MQQDISAEKEAEYQSKLQQLEAEKKKEQEEKMQRKMQKKDDTDKRLFDEKLCTCSAHR